MDVLRGKGDKVDGKKLPNGRGKNTKEQKKEQFDMEKARNMDMKEKVNKQRPK